MADDEIKITVDDKVFNQFERDCDRLKKDYPGMAEKLLIKYAENIRKDTIKNTPMNEGAPKKGVKPGQLAKSWKRLKPKAYKGGSVLVVRVQSKAPHAHLIELGHDIYRGGKTRLKGKRMSDFQLSKKNITYHGRVKGRYMLTDAIDKWGTVFQKKFEDEMDKKTKGLEA